MGVGQEVESEFSSSDLEQIKCPVCRADKSNFAFRRADHATVVRCGECGLLYLNPRPPDSSVASFYDESYFAEGGHGSGYRDYMAHQMAELKSGKHPGFLALHLLGRHSSPAGRKVLDVGCGGGHLLSLIRKRGYHVQGLDVSEHIAAEARSAFDLDVFPGDLKNACFPRNSFDVVTALEVIEHLTDPVEWLREIQEILKPDGILLLSTPNAGCAEVYREQWFGFNASFEHLTFFTSDTVARALQMAGFRVLEARTFGDGGPPREPGGWSMRAALKGILRFTIGLVPPLLAFIRRQRMLRGFRPIGEQPHGHTLWLIAGKRSGYQRD